MFEICNGCKKTIRDQKKHNMVEEHCALMKQIAPKIIAINQKHAGQKIIDWAEKKSRIVHNDYSD
jgi:hypothetical protein